MPSFLHTRTYGLSHFTIRSVCPGKFLAEDSLWLTTAQFLAVFDVSFADPKSVPKIEWHSGAITYALLRWITSIQTG